MVFKCWKKSNYVILLKIKLEMVKSMAVGKVSETILKRSVVNLLKCSQRTGVDAAVFPNKGSHILSANAVGLTESLLSPDMAVFKAANNIWVSGGEVVGMEASFILPKSYNEYNLKAFTKRVKAACEICRTTLSGGHTEVTDAVKRFCISVTAIGVTEGKVPSVKNIRPGMDIVVTKWIALEEMAMIFADETKKEELYTRFSREYLEIINRYYDWLTVYDEAAVAIEHGVTAMHDISDGGIFGALWELSQGAGCGFDVDLKAIPIRQETVEVAGFFRLNPYIMKSSGSVLMVCDDGNSLAEALDKAGIPATVIGKITDNNSKILRNEDEIRYLDKM